jgi:hypothetical protein
MKASRTRYSQVGFDFKVLPVLPLNCYDWGSNDSVSIACALVMCY